MNYDDFPRPYSVSVADDVWIVGRAVGPVKPLGTVRAPDYYAAVQLADVLWPGSGVVHYAYATADWQRVALACEYARARGSAAHELQQEESLRANRIMRRLARFLDDLRKKP